MAYFTRFYGLLYPVLGANPMSQFFGSSFFETRLSSQSLEHLIGFLVYIWSQNYATKNKVVKIATPTNSNLGWITPSLSMAVIRRQNRLESCSNSLKTREDL